MVALVSTAVTSPHSSPASAGRRRWGRGAAGRCAGCRRPTPPRRRCAPPGGAGPRPGGAAADSARVLRLARSGSAAPPSSPRSERCAPPRRSASVTRRASSAARPSSSASSRSSTGGRASSWSTRVPDPVRQERAQLVAHRRQRVEQIRVALLDQGAGGRHQGAEAARGDLDPEARRHDLLELVGLVEDDHVVLGQYRPAAGQVGAVEVGVHHHDVGRGRPVAGRLGEAAASRRAVEGARALARSHAHHVPGPVGRFEAAGRPGRPCPTSATTPSACAPLRSALRVERSRGLRRRSPPVLGARRSSAGPVGPAPARLVTQLGLDPARSHLGHPLAADVVAPTLQDGVVQRGGSPSPASTMGRSLPASWSCSALVAVATTTFLPLERRRDEIGQRLARPGAGLDDQVGPRDQRLGDGAAHLLLFGPVFAARHLRRDLVESVDGVVARLAGVRRRPPRGPDDVCANEVVSTEVVSTGSSKSGSSQLSSMYRSCPERRTPRTSTSDRCQSPAPLHQVPVLSDRSGVRSHRCP